MSELVDWGYRTVELLVLSLLPVWGTLDVAPARTGLATLSRLAWLMLLVAIAVAVARYGWRKQRALVLAGSCVVGLAAWRAYQPQGLERELPFIAPPLWLTLIWGLDQASVHARPGGKAWQQRAPALLAGLTAVAFSFAVAWPRVGSELGARRSTLQSDPGNEGAALRLAQLLDVAEGVRASSAVLRACARINSDACHCLTRAVERDLEREAYAAASELLYVTSEACSRQPSVLAMSAEIAAATSIDESFAGKVALAVERAPTAPHTWYAQALVSLRQEDFTAARQLCERAIAAQRGAAAHATLGAVLHRLGEFDAAEASLSTALRSDPENLRALYNLALLDQVRERPMPARAGYARVLELDPQYWDARYNLALLAQRAGDEAEAQRQLEALADGAGRDDARAAALRSLLGAR